MAVSVSQIKNDIFLSDASHLYITPWTYDESSNKWAPGATTYDVVDILADSISIEQADPETNNRDWEFGDAPLYQAVTNGELTFTATCIDMGNDVLKHLFGWKAYSASTTEALVAAPSTAADFYATIVITFHSTSLPVVVFPRVKMSSKAVLASLKTSTAECTLSGTALNAYVKYTNGGQSTTPAFTPYAFVKSTDGASISISNSNDAGATFKEIGAIETSNGETELVSVE